MGVYEDLLKRKKIIEDEQGNVTANTVVNKEIRDKLTDNRIQTYQQDMANNRNAIQSMNNIMQRTAKNTIWEQMQNLMFNKPINKNSIINSIGNNFTSAMNQPNKTLKEEIRDTTRNIDSKFKKLLPNSNRYTPNINNTFDDINRQAENRMNNDRQMYSIRENASAYNEALKAYNEEQNRKTIQYKQLKEQNPNLSEEELLKKVQDKLIEQDIKYDEAFKNMSKDERRKEIYKMQRILNDKDGLFETEQSKYLKKNTINNLRTKSEIIEAEKEAEKINNTLNKGNFLERSATATGELAKSMEKSAIDMTMSPIISAGSLAEGILPTNNFKGTKFDDIIDYKKMKDYKESVKNSNIENKVLKAGKGVSSIIGGMIPSIIANITMPGSNIGMITQALGVGGEDYIENLNENKTNKLQSALSGTLKGLGSYATEKITGGNILGKGSLDDWATRTIANGTSKIENETLKKITQKIASKIYEVGGENFEELLENQIDHLVDTTVNNKGITFKEWLDEQSETVKQTTLTKLFLNLMGVGGDTYNEVQKYSQNAEIKQWINEAQKIIDKENLNIDNYKINNNNINEVRKTLNELPIENATANLQQQSTQTKQILPIQQITQQENKTAQNGNMKQINDNLANNQQTLYNNSKERESDSNVINRGTQETDLERDFSESRLLEERKQTAEQNYREWEKSIKSKQDSELTHEEQQLINKSKSEYNKKEIKNSNKSSFSFDKINSKIETDSNINKLTDKGITMTYVHMNNQNTQNFGTTYGQNIEPSGEYMNVDTMQGKYKVPGADYGTIHFKQPLVLDHVNTGETGWKKTLSDMFENKTGKELSNAIKKAGYDGIITIDEDGYYSEVVNINGNKINNIENNQNSLYNINNESESDINGQINQRNDGTSRLFEESTEKQREYSWDEYNKWEESIKPTENITNKEQQSINKSKSEHNKDVFLYDENDNDNTYSGGASRNVKNKINISRQQAEYFGLDFMIDHETIESDILQNQELYEDIVKPVIEKIQKDNNFKKQVDEFWRNEEGNKPSDRLIAKDIFCDRFAQMRGNELKYENILSQETNMNIDYALNNFYKEIYGKEIEDSNKSSFNLPTKEDVKTKLNLPTKEKMNQSTQGEKINWNEIERPEGKIRKHYRSIIESGNTTKEAKAIAKELMGMDTYIPDSNNKQLERADTRIQNSTPESELDSLMSRATIGGKIDATDIAVGEKLIQYYSLIGDKAKLQESIQATAMAGTTAGQAVQAMSLLNHQTPEGQAVWIQRSVEKMNNDLRKARGEKAQQFDFTAEMQEKIVNSKNNEELQDNLNAVYKELGQQVNKNLIEKIDSWRYFSMLGNPKTHIRNMVGNFLMGKVQDTKNKVAGVIEGTVAKFNTDMERMHTIKRASKEVIDFAKNDIKNVSDRLGLNDNKYNPKSRLENNMRTFKSDVMENTLGRLFKWNDNLLEAEDGLGLKAGYKKALSEYITANNIDVNNITDTQLSKARNYAVQQAQERTFHQANIIASAINSFFGKNKATKAIGDAVLPFVKTPANVAKTGIEYSPAGLAKSIVYDSVQLRKGNINVNQYIDNVSKGLTGSAITVLGFALAQAGILKASGSDDDKKEKFDEQSGKQAYSIQIGDNTYTIDWLAPVGIPLMVGAEIYEGLSQKSNEKKTKSSDDEDVTKQFWDRAEVLANSLSNTLDPMVEMSMISGLTSTVRSFAQGDTQALGNMLTNGAKSYINQFIPTLLGQIAKTTDTLERDTTSTKSGTISKAVDSTTNQIKSKIPGLRQTLPTKKDIWGKDITLANNWPQRFFEAGILPTNSKTINKDKVVTELNNLYDKMGESSILPKTIDKTFMIDGQKYRMTNEEYNKYKTNYGQTSYKLIKNLVSSEEYGKMNDKQKQKAIENVYNYAKENNKLDYAKNNKLECEQSTLYTTMQDLKNNGGSQSEYLNYLSKTTELNKDKDKNQILVDSNYTDKTKAIIYRNTTGKEDELYNNLLSKDNINININEYLKYKLQEFESDRKDDGTTSGEAISGSKKKKVYSYVNNMNITREQKLILLGMQYKLSNSERTELANLINKLPNTSKDEKMKLYEKMQGFTVYKNGTIKW